MCSIPTTCRPCLCTICTARAPEAVGTFRTNEATAEATNHPISHPEHHPSGPSPQVSEPETLRARKCGTSQARGQLDILSRGAGTHAGAHRAP